MELFAVVGTVITQNGRYSEFWIEGYTQDEVWGSRYVDRMNQIHEETDEDETVQYTLMPIYSLHEGGEIGMMDYGDAYDA